MRLDDALAVHVGGTPAARVYLGSTLIWEPGAADPGLPPITAGLLWSTDAAIDFTKTGPEVPPIPMTRAAGPVYCAISVRIDATDGVIFRVGNPGDNYHVQNTFQLEHWGDAYSLQIAPGWPNQVIGQVSPGFPDELVLEFWLSAGGSDFVDHQQFGWLNSDMPDADVAASSHLFIGYRLDSATVSNRGAGSIRRMAIFDRVPTPAERAQLVAWVQD